MNAQMIESPTIARREYISHFHFMENDKKHHLTLGILLYHQNMPFNKASILSKGEIPGYTNLRSRDKRRSFLAGRYAAKHTIINRNPQYEMSDITIVNGIWGFPLIYTQGLATKEISITHSRRIAAALYCDYTTHPIGINTEHIDVHKADILKQWIRPAEYQLLEGDINRRLFLLWSAKEAAGKALRTGFGLPENFLGIEQVINMGQYYLLSFKHIPQLSVLSWHLNQHVFSIAFPNNWQLI